MFLRFTVGAKKSSASESAERRTPQSGKAAKDLAPGDADVEGSDMNEYAGDDVVALSSPPQPVPAPGAYVNYFIIMYLLSLETLQISKFRLQ